MAEVRGRQIKDKSITKDQIADKEITTDQIADLTIVDQNIALNADISQSKIAGLISTLDNKLDKTGGTLTGPVVLQGDPTNPLDAATKQYVDGVTSGSRYLLSKNYNLLDSNLQPLHAPFTTNILSTQNVSTFNDNLSFSLAESTNYEVKTNTLIVDFGTTRFLYQLGGSQGSTATEIINVSKTSLGADGTQSIWSSVGSPDLPEPASAAGQAAVLETTAGKHIVKAKGKGDNLFWRSQPIDSLTGDYAGWDVLDPLPFNAGDPEIVILDINGEQVGYVLLNDFGGSSELVVVTFDSNGDVQSLFVNTIPQTTVGKMVSVGTRLYIFGTGVDSNKLFIGDINTGTKDVTWNSYTTDLPLGLTEFNVSSHTTIQGDSFIYVYGGILSGVFQDSIYKSNIDNSGLAGSFVLQAALLFEPTAGFGVSAVRINGKDYVYVTGGQTDIGFSDHSTIKVLIESKSYKVISREIGSGSFYHVNNDESIRPAQSFNIQPNINDDPTLSAPINIFYYATKVGSTVNYSISKSVEPSAPFDISDQNNLLIRIDQVDPITGDVKSLPVTTTPVYAQDFFEEQKIVNRILSINSSAISVNTNNVIFGNGAFKVGNLKRVFSTPAYTTPTFNVDQVKWVYWSNYDYLLLDEEQQGKILLGKIAVEGGILTFTPATSDLTGIFNLDLNANETITIMHGFNSYDIFVQHWVGLDNNSILNDSAVIITKLGLNELQVENTSANPISIKVLVKKEA